MEDYEVDLLCDKKVNLSNPIFSQREIEVLAFLCNGRSHKFIASVLNVSVRTVESHVRNIVTKSALASMEHVLNSLTFSGDINILNSIYAYKMYTKEFENFINKFNTEGDVAISYGDDISPAIVEKIKSIFEHIGLKIISDTSQRTCKRILITNRENADIVPDNFYILDLSIDGFYLAVLKCLGEILNDSSIDLEIQKCRKSIFDEQKVDLLIGRKQDWREKMNKGGVLGIATSVCGALVLAGGLYGIYPRANDVITITNQDSFMHTFFFDRADLVNQILNALSDANQINVVILTGPGGAGKTTLAENVMVKEADKYTVTYKIKAENEGELTASLLDLANKLAHTKQLQEILLGIESDGKTDRRRSKIVAFIKERLKKQKKWLLVFDNVEDIELIRTVCPNEGKGNIIITTRDQNINYNLIFGNKKIINVGELCEGDKIALFNAVLSKINSSVHYDKRDIKRLMNHIPSYPLDVTTVACSIAGLNITVDEYIHMMNAAINNFENIDEALMYNSTPYGKTRYGIIVTTLDRILQEMRDNSDVKAALLAISMCEAQDIPSALFGRYKDLALQKDVLKLLRKYSFITESNARISIHRVVQDMWRKILCKKMSTEELKKFLDTFFSNVLPFKDITYEYRRFKKYSFSKNFYSSMMEHVKRFVSLLESLPLSKEDKERYMAQALAVKSVLAASYSAKYKEIANDLKTVLKINEVYHIYNEYEVAILLNQLWGALEKFDRKSSKLVMQRSINIIKNIGDEALPMKIRFKLDECTDAMMAGNQKLGNQLLREGFDMLPKTDDYWARLLYTELRLFITDFEVQNHLNNKKLASATADLFTKLLVQLDAKDIKTSIELAKKDMMPRLVASLMAERIWTYNLAERYEEANAAYSDYVEYLKVYPIAKYELRAQTYNSTTLARLNKLDEAKKMAVTTYNQWKLADSKGMVYETLADLTEICVRRGEYEEALQYAADNPGDCGMQGVVQAFADARSFFNYGIAALKLKKETESLKFFNKSLEKTKIVAKSCMPEEQFKLLDFAEQKSAYKAFCVLKTAFNTIFGAANKFVSDYVNVINDDALENKSMFERIKNWIMRIINKI